MYSKKTKHSSKIIFFVYAALAYVLGVLVFAVFQYYQSKKELYEDVDSRLIVTAKSVSMILAREYHDFFYTDEPQAKNNFNASRPILNEFARNQKVRHIYTVIPKGSKLLFSSISDSDEEVIAGTAAKFLEEYHDAPKELIALAKSKKEGTVFCEYDDKWGSFRSIFTLKKTELGNIYIIGVDIERSEIRRQAYSDIWSIFRMSAFFLLLASPGVFFYALSVKKSKQDLMRQVLRDPLTGLRNRFAMIRKINEVNPYALMLINIDSFREINDFYGHKTGDKLLRQISEKLSRFVVLDAARVSSETRLYKLHADEFGILFFGRTSTDELGFVAEVLAQQISSSPFVANGHEIVLNATIGISCSPDNDGQESAKYFMTASNIALKEAKTSKKPFMFYDKKMQVEQRYEHNLVWLGKLKNALANDKITAYYQPILNNQNGKIEKFECLARLIDENGDVVAPYFFLDVAKKSRLYHKVTKAVIQKSFARFADSDFSFGINLSVLDIGDRDICEFIVKKVEKSGIGNRVLFEILESEGIDNYEEVYSFVDRVKKFGCQISIDDFGAGYSNFDHILKLKPNFIKIDGSLIKNLDTDKNAQIITKSIVSFAGELGAKSVAEFVHSEEIFEIVKAIGIDYSQGYYIAPPKADI